MSTSAEEPIPGTEGYEGEVNSDELYANEGDGEENGGYADGEEDPELEEMKRRVQEMEDEQEKLNKLQQQVEKQINSTADSIDENSVYALIVEMLVLLVPYRSIADTLAKWIMKQP